MFPVAVIKTCRCYVTLTIYPHIFIIYGAWWWAITAFCSNDNTLSASHHIVYIETSINSTFIFCSIPKTLSSPMNWILYDLSWISFAILSLGVSIYLEVSLLALIVPDDVKLPIVDLLIMFEHNYSLHLCFTWRQPIYNPEATTSY